MKRNGTPVRAGRPPAPRRAVGKAQLQAEMLASSLAAVAALDGEGRLTHVNPAGLRLFGYDDPGEVLGRLVSSFVRPPAEAERALEAARRLGSWEGRLTAVKRDGTPFEILVAGRELRDGGAPCYIVSYMDLTPQVRSESALRESERRYRAIVDSQTDAVCRWLPDTTLTFMNNAYAKLFGKNPEDLLGRRWLDLLPEDVREGIRPFYEDLACQPRDVSCEHAVDTADGTTRWIHWTDTPIFDDAGRLLEFKSVGRDVTDRKRAEEALAESERQYRGIFENTLVGICRSTPGGRYLSVNPAMARMLGYDSPEEMLREVTDIGRQLYADPAEREAGIKRLEQTDRLASFEVRLRRRDGSPLWGLVNSRAVRDDAGAIRYIESVLVDITALKEAGEALRSSEERFLRAFSSSPVAMTIGTIRDGVYLDVNDRYLEMTGYERGELIGRSSVGLGVWADPGERDSLVRRLRQDGSVRNASVRRRRKDGRIIHVLWSASVIRVGGEEVLLTTQLDITEKHEAEQKLRVSEERFAKAFHESPAAMSIATVDEGVYIDVNERFLEMMGYGRGELIGRSSVGLGVWADPGDREELVRRLRRDGYVRNAPVRRRRKDGGEIHVLWSASIISLGGVEALIATHIDVTDRYEAERKLRASEERFSKAFRFNPAPMVISTLEDGVIIDVNESFVNLLGYPPELLMGASALSLGLWEDPAARAAIVGDLERDGCVQDRHVLLVTRGGEKREVLFSAEIISLGGLKCMLSLLRDITERQKLERELRAAQHRLAGVIDFLPDATFVVDRDGVVTMWNRAMEEMTGVAAAEMIGRGGFAYAIPFYGERRPILIDAALGRPAGDAGGYRFIERKRGYVIAEAKVPALRGSCRVLQGTASVIPGPDGEIVGAIESIRDLTEQRELEQRLFRAQKLEALGSLAGGVAHDFNNLLTSIAGYAELTRMDLAEGEHAANLDQVLRAADRARQLVKQILTFSRKSESGKRPLDIGEHLRGSMDMIRAMIPPTIDLRVSIAGGDPGRVLIDPVHVDQIVLNLCSNAEHAMRGHTGALEVSLAPVEHSGRRCRGNGNELPPGRYLRLSVSDTGHGIDTAILDRVFDPFFTTKPPGEGTGLGLSVVYGIVRDHGGCIEVESRPGEGTAFHVDLPLASADHADRNPDEGCEAAGRAARVLLVDDEPMVLALAERVLGSLGHRVTAAPGGLEALGRFRPAPEAFDLVITDLMMPGMTGIDLAREILKIRKDMPILACTGYGSEGSPENLGRTGFRGVLLKPFTRRDLDSAVRRALEPIGG